MFKSSKHLFPILCVSVCLLALPVLTAGDPNPVNNQKPALTLKTTEKSLGKIDGMVEKSLIISPDCQHVAYVVRDEKFRAVIDGNLGKEYDFIDSNFFAVSHDWKRVVYAARQKDKSFPVVDGQGGKEVRLPVRLLRGCF